MHSRWDQLFADLEAQAVALEHAERGLAVADRTRGELARVQLVSRLHSRAGRRIALQVSGAGPVSGRLARVGADWVLLDGEGEVLVPLGAIMALLDLPLNSLDQQAVGSVAGRLTLGVVLRAMARDRSVVVVRLRDGLSVTGTPDRVGADFVDVAQHESDAAPRPGEVQARWTVPWRSIATVSRR